MSRATATDLVYLVAIVGFIFALIGLSSPKHARIGNLAGATGMLIAVAWTFSLPSVYGHTKNLVLIIIAVVIGTAIGVPAARNVKMTAMPQMVAIFNGVGRRGRRPGVGHRVHLAAGQDPGHLQDLRDPLRRPGRAPSPSPAAGWPSPSCRS